MGQVKASASWAQVIRDVLGSLVGAAGGALGFRESPVGPLAEADRGDGLVFIHDVLPIVRRPAGAGLG